MRYVDIGTLNQSSQPQSKQSAGSRSKGQGSRPSSMSRWLKGGITFVLLGALVFGIYSFLPPIKETLASVFNGSGAVFTYLVKGKQELAQDGGKTNVLLLGIDKRADEPYTFVGANGTVSRNCFRTDTMIVASYNYDTKKVTMLSLPRDLWIKIPAFGKFSTQSTKINAAYCFGDEYNYPGGGIALATKVVSDYFGIPIHYTARIDFAGLKQAVDAVGGVDINVDRAFTDYEYPVEGKENALPMSARYKTVSFKAGLQHMNGETALEYARSRHAFGPEGSDFARAKRQQKVIAAFKDKVFSADAIKSPAALEQLYQSLGDSFATDAGLTDLPAAYDIAKTVDTSQIGSYNLDDNPSNPGGLLYAPPQSEYGAYVLIPKDTTGSDVREFVQQIFSDQGLGGQSTPSATVQQ